MLPVAIRAGFPALGVAMAMNLFGHGIALSGDFIIQAAPNSPQTLLAYLSAMSFQQVFRLVITMGVVTTVSAFFFLKRDMKRGILKPTENEDVVQEK